MSLKGAYKQPCAPLCMNSSLLLKRSLTCDNLKIAFRNIFHFIRETVLNTKIFAYFTRITRKIEKRLQLLALQFQIGRAYRNFEIDTLFF